MQDVSKQSQIQQKLSTVTQAAAELNCSARSIWRLLAAKQLESVRIGRAVRITRESIDQFIAQGGER